jgi:hypothetical protein
MPGFLERLDDYAATGTLPEVEWVLRAAPHKWGIGKVHIWGYEDDRTQCGRDLPACPGIVVPGQREDVSCKSCIRSHEMPKRWEEHRAEAERRAEIYWQKWVARWGPISWRDAYEQHLASPEWQALRQEVFARCRGECERCHHDNATQLHHLTYERLGDELLADLLGVCRGCHEAIHGIPWLATLRDGTARIPPGAGLLPLVARCAPTWTERGCYAPGRI